MGLSSCMPQFYSFGNISGMSAHKRALAHVQAHMHAQCMRTNTNTNTHAYAHAHTGALIHTQTRKPMQTVREVRLPKY